jgi:monoamine oxidase
MNRWLSILLPLLIGVACAPPRPSAPVTPSMPSPAPSSTEVARVIIVGGGIAGLVAGYELEQQGVSVHVLEMSDRLGGRIATAHYGPGLTAEYGMEEIWSKSPLAVIVRGLGLELDDSEGALSSVLLDGKLHAYSQDTADEYLHALFDTQEYAAVRGWMTDAEKLFTELESSGMSAKLAPLNDISFASWLEQRKLPPRVLSFLRLTLECELGSDAQSFSALSGLAEFRVFLFGGESALHVKGGNDRVISALAAALHGEKTLGARVIAVARSTDKEGRLSAQVTFVRNDQVEALTAERVLLAVPWTQLHNIQLDPPLPTDVWDAVNGLGHGEYTVVHFLVDKQIQALWGGQDNQPFPVLTPGPLGVIYGTESTPSDQSLQVFSLLVHGVNAGAFHMQPLERKRDELLRELEALWPGFSRFVRGANVYTYHPAAIPYWPPGRSPYDAPAQRLFQAFDGVYLAGDYLVSSHSEGAVRAAQRQARAIVEDLQRPRAQPRAAAP